MFSKNNIIIIKETMLTKSDMIDYEKNSNDLYKLVTDIIQELNIKTLSKIIVNCKMSFFGQEAGRAIFTMTNGKLASTIEIGRKTFCQFNNAHNIELRNEAISVIYHEFFHVHDRENIVDLISTYHIKNKLYFTCGIKYWSEFYAYYKSSNIHTLDLPFRKIDSLFIEIKSNRKKINSEEFYYFISAAIAYISNNKYKNELNDSCLNYFYKGQNFNALFNKLNDILCRYPKNITCTDFEQLGALYDNLLSSL